MDEIESALKRYIEDGIRPGAFTCAVIANDLIDAVLYADESNLSRIKQVAIFVADHVDPRARGSYEAINHHIESKGTPCTQII